MKKLLVLATTILLTAGFISAQANDPELDFIKKAYSKEKKTIVEEYMDLDVQQAAKFWPVYASYESSREKLALKRLQLIDQYASNAEGITAELADKIANGLFNNTISLEKLNLETYNKMKVAIGAIKAAKYMQLEVYLQTTWRAVIQDNLPLIEELDKTQKN